MDDISAVARTAASAMQAQTHRMRITAENMANADTTGNAPGADPFRRKVLSFETVLDSVTGARMVGVSSVSEDPSPFRTEYNPSHMAADANGMVKQPNVEPMIELANMREASRSFEANMSMYEASGRMRDQILGILEK